MAAQTHSFLPEIEDAAQGGGDLRESLRTAARMVGADAVALARRSTDGIPRVVGWWSSSEELGDVRNRWIPSGQWRDGAPPWSHEAAANVPPREEWAEIPLTDFGASLWLARDPGDPPLGEGDSVLLRQLGERALAAAVLRGDFRAGPAPVRPGRAPSAPDGELVESSSARRFVEGLSAIPDAIVCLDADMTVVLFNPGAERMFGYRAGEILGRPAWGILPELQEFEAAAAFLPGGAAGRGGSLGMEMRARRRGREEFTVEASVAAGPAEHRPMLILVLRDVTVRQRHSAGRELLLVREREGRRRAEEAVLARDEVLAMVSHDLRNPLNVVALTLRSFARARLPTAEKPEPVQRQLEVALNAADRMRRMLRDLLDVTQIERRSLAVQPVRSDLRKVLREAEESIRHLAEGERIRVEVEMEAGLPRVWADPERILQALVNLLENALQNSPPESTIRLRADLADGLVRIAVSDQGPGIPAADRSRVFDRFWKGRSGRSTGVGLGLAIVKGIVDTHGGRIWVDAQEGRGSTFYLMLPAAGDDAA